MYLNVSKMTTHVFVAFKITVNQTPNESKQYVKIYVFENYRSPSEYYQIIFKSCLKVMSGFEICLDTFWYKAFGHFRNHFRDSDWCPNLLEISGTNYFFVFFYFFCGLLRFLRVGPEPDSKNTNIDNKTHEKKNKMRSARRNNLILKKSFCK